MKIKLRNIKTEHFLVAMMVKCRHPLPLKNQRKGYRYISGLVLLPSIWDTLILISNPAIMTNLLLYKLHTHTHTHIWVFIYMWSLYNTYCTLGIMLLRESTGWQIKRSVLNVANLPRDRKLSLSKEILRTLLELNYPQSYPAVNTESYNKS